MVVISLNFSDPYRGEKMGENINTVHFLAKLREVTADFEKCMNANPDPGPVFFFFGKFNSGQMFR